MKKFEANRRYREEILPGIVEQVNRGEPLDLSGVPEEFHEVAEQDYHDALDSEYTDKLYGDFPGMATGMKIGKELLGMGETAWEGMKSLDKKLKGFHGIDESGKFDESKRKPLPSMDEIKDFGEEVAADSLDDVMRTLTDPGRIVKKPVATVLSVTPVVGGAVKMAGKLKRGKQLELPLDDAAKRHNGNGEIDLEETMDRKDSPFEKDLEVDDDSPSMEMSDDSKKGQLGAIRLKRVIKQIREEDLPEITPLNPEDYPEITPRRKREIDDILKDFIEEDRPKKGLDPETESLIKDWLKFKATDKPKGDAAGFSRVNDIKKSEVPAGLAERDAMEREARKEAAKRATVGMRAAAPDDFDIDEVTPNWAERKPKSSVEQIDWADDADDVEEYAPVIKETKISIKPADVTRGFGGAEKEALAMAQKAKAMLEEGSTTKSAMGKRLLTDARASVDKMLKVIDADAAKASDDLKLAKNQMRAVQGKGVAPDEKWVKMADEAEAKLAALDEARSGIVDPFSEIDADIFDFTKERTLKEAALQAESEVELPKSFGERKMSGLPEKNKSYEVDEDAADDSYIKKLLRYQEPKKRK